MKKIVIGSWMRCKNKQSFFALHQIQNKIHTIDPAIEIEFHILWDSDQTVQEKMDDPKWSNLIDTHIKNVHAYNKEFFKSYVRDYYDETDVDKFDRYGTIYHVLMAQYLRRVKLYDYYLVYDDDILINDDFSHVLEKLLNKIPVLIAEPLNYNCDKAFFQRIVSMYGNEFIERYRERNPQLMGFNSGFQGVDLSMYDSFLSVDRFTSLLSMFDYKGIYDENGNEIWGDERFLFDTQQQSFCSLMNIVLSKRTPHILNPNEYFVVPNFGTHPVYGPINHEDEFCGYGVALKSKITHFIGHTRGKGKPKIVSQKADEYLINNGFEV
jgi:hypothetical protein